MSEGDSQLASCLALLERLGLARGLGQPVTGQEVAALADRVWPDGEEAREAAQALLSPHLAVTMLWRTLGRGLRGNPHHPRRLDLDGRRLTADLLALLRLHTRLLPQVLAASSLPPGGLTAGDLHGDGGWCDLCGQCCCHAGVVPAVPAGVDYSPAWHHALAGERVWPQPFCPFLFQALSRPLFFCAIHPIKPLPCRVFGQNDCQRGLAGRGCRPPTPPAQTYWPSPSGDL